MDSSACEATADKTVNDPPCTSALGQHYFTGITPQDATTGSTNLHSTDFVNQSSSETPARDIVLGKSLVPHDVAMSALQGKYINIAHFASMPLFVDEQDYEFDIQSMQWKTPLPAISKYEEWLVAWYAYEE